MPNHNTVEAATRNSNSAHHTMCGDCNGRYPNPALSINWRASLVPAAAVIPAPIAYANAAAVKKLVVGFRVRGCILPTITRPRANWHRGPAVWWGKTGCVRPQLFHSRNRLACGNPLNWAAEALSAWNARVWSVRGCYCEQNSVSKAGYLQPE